MPETVTRDAPGRVAASVPARLVIIDDSVVARVMLAQVFDSEPGFQVCAAFDRVERALAWLALHECDIILLDIELPGRSGLAALPDLLAASGRARIVVVSSMAAEGAAATLQALSLGAADAIGKPESGAIGRQFGVTLVERLRRLAGSADRSSQRPMVVPVREAGQSPVGCVAIGASTGGIHAIARFFSALPATFDAPILVTQHLPTEFIPFFAEQLAMMTRRRCTVAQDAAPLKSGMIYIAPGDRHLGIGRQGETATIALSSGMTSSHCLPSVDPMFKGVGETFGEGAVGVVLSGMGRDGGEGAEVLVDCGGSVIVQDADSSTIWGMPGTVARKGLASLVSTPERLADHLAWRGVAR